MKSLLNVRSTDELDEVVKAEVKSPPTKADDELVAKLIIKAWSVDTEGNETILLESEDE